MELDVLPGTACTTSTAPSAPFGPSTLRLAPTSLQYSQLLRTDQLMSSVRYIQLPRAASANASNGTMSVSRAAHLRWRPTFPSTEACS